MRWGSTLYRSPEQAFYAIRMPMDDVPAPGELHQQILNEHWPADPGSYRNRHPGIPVRVRVAWQRDGEEWIDGTARRWDRSHVWVEIIDRRRDENGVWLKPCDVYRRPLV